MGGQRLHHKGQFVHSRRWLSRAGDGLVGNRPHLKVFANYVVMALWGRLSPTSPDSSFQHMFWAQRPRPSRCPISTAVADILRRAVRIKLKRYMTHLHPLMTVNSICST